MSRSLITAAAAVAAVLLALAAPATEAASGSRAAVVGIEAEPACLNVLRVECNQFVSHVVAAPVLAGAFRLRPGFVFEPVLVERVDVRTEPFTLTYHIKPEAVWSDGAPIGAEDFLFTLQTIQDPSNNTLRTDYEHVVEATYIDAKTFALRFSAPNPNWRQLFQYVLPKHVLAGHDFDTVWRYGIEDPATHAPIGSGPFLVTEWTRGQKLTLAPNPRWWGATGPFLDRIDFSLVPSSVQIEAIRTGTVDLIFPQPQAGIATLRTAPGVVVETAPGTAMEHLDFNVASTSMPLLRERWFRQAVAFSIDRDAVAATSHNVLVTGHPALHNLTLSNLEPGYDPVFARYTHDPAAVAALMTANGCGRGADSIWVCGGVRASVRFATTSGNAQRELVQRDMVEQALATGIELVPDNSPPGTFFGSVLGGRTYESIMFAWVRGASVPSVYELYGCTGENNFMGYCSSDLDALARAADTELDPVERVRRVNAANAVLAEDVPSLPLFMRIALLVRRDTLRGPAINPGGFPSWNAEAWRGPDTTPPRTVAAATPSANAAGWNPGTVTVTLRATDDDSGVAAIRYTLAGASTVVSADAATVTIAAEGVTTLSFSAVDAAGNEEAPQSMTIRIDRTAPVLRCTADPATLGPPNRRLVPVQVAVNATDALSGIAGYSLVSATGGGPGDISGFDVGTADTSGSLRAELDAGRERRYALVYEASDLAGNVARCTASVDVVRGR